MRGLLIAILVIQAMQMLVELNAYRIAISLLKAMGIVIQEFNNENEL